MKKLIFALKVLALAFVAIQANAQALDMSLTSPTVSPSPAVFPGFVTITFNVVAQENDETLSSDDLSSSFSSMSISLSNVLGSPLTMPTGAGANLYTWTYNLLTNSYIGFSKDVTIAANVAYPITLSGLLTTGVITTNEVGFLANLNPPGDLQNSESENDAASAYTTSKLILLPPALTSFEVEKEGQQAVLRWATTEETNSDDFEVQHSVNGKEWVKIEKGDSYEKSTVLKNHTFFHETPVNGRNLYRIKMINRSGGTSERDRKDETFAYSGVRGVRFENGITIAGYPNPATDRLLFKEYAQIQQAAMYNSTGTRVLDVGKVTADGIDVSRLNPGIYQVKLTLSDGTLYTHKVAVAR